MENSMLTDEDVRLVREILAKRRSGEIKEVDREVENKLLREIYEQAHREASGL